MSLAERVKEARKRMGWNQKQLADASGISQATISRLEAGRVRELKSEALKQLAAALGVTVDYLVDQAVQLTFSDAVQADPTVQAIFRGYEKLSATNRQLLKNFVQMLEEREQTENKETDE
jgi:transcriptional regulator with XRE-family HTH domain